ncbi:uncharacterized protein DUF3156 [Raoultella sp. BIGb0399]|uniref:DUF3156 family protein n=1 Tax=Raoultella lignicola TaxID=3040939 RepID=A0ABU9FFC1_9ENTR|nr:MULTISPECIES: DUF3156 family protein [Enterobacteriaceae]QNK05615.1 DUF3156 family protein [Enterobacter sp. JUb54]ROS13663.1 uncharacterized protein DUF3156 [Raoultella sp. BIGb0399]
MSSVPSFSTPLMNAVQRDLAGWPGEKLSERSAVLHLNASTDVTVSVRQKRLFMASIHSCEFVVEGPVSRPAQGKIRAHQSGWLKRQPVTFRGSKTAAELARYLNGFPRLQQTLSELDYRRFTFTLDDQRWRCCIEPWAASEVVCKMPPLRRYLRLEKQQRMLLLSVMSMMHQAVNQWMQETLTTEERSQENASPR